MDNEVGRLLNIITNKENTESELKYSKEQKMKYTKLSQISETIIENGERKKKKKKIRENIDNNTSVCINDSEQSDLFKRSANRKKFNNDSVNQSSSKNNLSTSSLLIEKIRKSELKVLEMSDTEIDTGIAKTKNIGMDNEVSHLLNIVQCKENTESKLKNSIEEKNKVLKIKDTKLAQKCKTNYMVNKSAKHLKEQKKNVINNLNCEAQKQIHTGVRPFKCDICDSAFIWKSHLTRHEEIHTGERPFQCDICDSAFIREIHLTNHKRIHSGKRPYKCDICDSAFAKNSDLTRHKRIHTKERPFKCDICDSAFAQKSNLSSHKEIHTGERPFKCDICDSAFTKKSNLSTHKRIHTGVRPF